MGWAPPARSQAVDSVPTAETHLGFRPGSDFRLAGWKDVVSYFEKVDRASPRVIVRNLGETTEGRPYLVAFVSSAETIANLEKYRKLQEQLSDPRKLADDTARRAAIAESKVVVAITCSIHSTETASTMIAMELLQGLATGDDPETKEILNRTIVVLVPSANPDGVDKVRAWYERSKGHPWEGSGLPELYHKYAGHDTNRDWFMLNLKETRLFTNLLYKEWFPTLLYDVHQMGGKGARIFVPPFYDPVNPNFDPRISQGIFVIGGHMASDLANAGKKGVLFGAQYDNWWNGGNRTTPQRHNIVAVLTEAASVKMASPVFLERDDLKGGARGFPDHQRAVNFVDPWPGGWWRLRDILEYELVCARSLLTLAARYRESYQSNLLSMASDAIKKGQTEPPYAWIVPRDQRDPGSAAKLVEILHRTGVEVHAAREPFEAAGISYPAGTWVFPAAQPYRAHLKDMMERQVYPTRMTGAGKAEAPYDVAGWTLPLQMGVKVVELGRPINARTDRLEKVEAIPGGIDEFRGADKPNVFVLGDTTNDDFIVRNALQEAGIVLRRRDVDQGGEILFPIDKKSREILDQVLPKLTTRVRLDELKDFPKPTPSLGPQVIPNTPALYAPGSTAEPREPRVLPRKRIALYQPWMPSMDEGWTRLVLESFRFSYKTVHNEDIRAGALGKFDVLLIPSIPLKNLRDGFGPNETEPDYVGGLGAEGKAALREFLEKGGRVVCLEEACDYAIDELNLSVKNVLKGLPTSEFFCPGSILRANIEEAKPFTHGVPSELSVYFDESRAFDVPSGPAEIVVRYAKHEPLESGWLLGPVKLAGKAALVVERVGNGQVVLFGFPPQHRGQPHRTFRLLFNALLD